jgi:RNA-binding protein 39
LKFSEVSSAEKAVKALNGRWFGGRQVIADYIPEKLYDVQFPKAASV